MMAANRRRAIGVRAMLAIASLALVVVPILAAPVIAASATVIIADGLSPAALEVTPGTTVTWTNNAADRHRMRTTSGPSEFDSGDLDPGASFSVTLNVLGAYQYRDDRNPNLSNYWGTITVASVPKPTPTPAPGTTPAPPAPTPAPSNEVLMAGRAFTPRTLTVDPGAVVRWRNNDGREHTVSAVNKAFDSGIMAVGAVFQRTFSTPGTYSYLCLIHPDMTGTIAVRTAGGATPPPPPPPTPAPKPTPVVTPPPGSGEVGIVDFAFNPGTVDVVAGTTVTWVNTGAALHTVTASDGSFDSGLVTAGGGRFSRRFAVPGTYPYLCALHPSMSGVVRVSGAGGATPPPPAPPTPAPTPPPVASGQLELRDFAFVPSSIRITPGTTVTWVNTGAAPHTVTERTGAFDSGILPRGARYSRSFPVAGTYQLLCSIHPEMHATLVVAAPGATPQPPATPAPVVTPAPGSGEVVIADFAFTPDHLSVPVGTTVRWTNQGVAPHTVTARDGSFDSGFLNHNEVFSRTLTTPGTIEYLCAIHPAMIGTVVVGDGGSGSGAAGSSAGPPVTGGGLGSGVPPGSSASGAPAGSGSGSTPGGSAAGSAGASGSPGGVGAAARPPVEAPGGPLPTAPRGAGGLLLLIVVAFPAWVAGAGAILWIGSRRRTTDPRLRITLEPRRRPDRPERAVPPRPGSGP
ncbi:MAG: plastocyanin/azurin family copper-binding protein, partial [Chloroflexota bacterium]